MKTHAPVKSRNFQEQIPPMPTSLRHHPLSETINRGLATGLVAMMPIGGIASAAQIAPNPNYGTIQVTGSDTNDETFLIMAPFKYLEVAL